MKKLIKPLYRLYRSIADSLFRRKLKRTKKVIVEKGVVGFRNILFGGNNSIGRFSAVSSLVELGYCSTIGAFNVIAGPVFIGPYCQFGQFVGVFGEDHPTSHLTTYVNHRLFDGRLRENLDRTPVHIGAGVWIGQGALILRGVKIGDGAIIGAGAVVTKDIPDYAIAVGNPARVVRMRFSPEVLDIILKFQWWKIPIHKLAEIEPIFSLDFGKNSDKMITELANLMRKYDINNARE